MSLFLDIETNSTASHIWICYTFDDETREFVCHTAADTLNPLIAKADKVIAHNLVGFDRPVLEKLWGTKICSSKVIDTLILSRLWQPSIENGHGLDAWGKRLGGTKKADYQRLYWRLQGIRKFDKKSSDHWDNPNQGLLRAYCKRDVKLLVDVYNYLQKELVGWGESVQLEHDVALIIQEQVEHGFKFDEKHATALQAELSGEVADLEGQLQAVFPPIITERWSEKTGKRLQDSVVVFNPGSRQQIADRLQGLGVKFKKKTEKGSIIVDEKVLSEIKRPEAKLINRYLMLQKRLSQIKSWFEELKPDGRIHGRVITNGAVTGRMTHSSPNMAQIPNAGSEYGPECRQCFIVDEGKVLVGADASGLELRMLAHFMEDEEYVITVTEGSSKDGTDVHTKNQKAAGLPTRDDAKTFIYAFLYGAGPAKIGSIVGGGAKDGEKLIASFLKATPSLKMLRDKVAKWAGEGYVPGLDGRKIWVRSEHAALNSLLQGAGAVVMKKALVLLDRRLKRNGVQYGFCANVHDEWQIETEVKHAEFVGKSAVWAIELAGRKLGLTCPLAGEYKIGKSWKETH